MPQRNLSLALGATAAKELYEKQVPTNLPTLSPPLFIPLYEAREMEPPTQRKLKAGQDGQDCIISEPLCNRVASHLEQAYLELFPLSDSLTISLDGRTDGWMDSLCATGDAPNQYLCDKEWHRWQLRAGQHSWYQMACHNRPRWIQALGFIFCL